MKRIITDRICDDCGRILEPGEVCNCRQPIRGSPRDGLRAVCPLFKCRSSYRGRSYIVCGKKTVYDGCDARNEHYKRFCCSLYGLCEIYKAMKGERETCKAKE